MDDFTIKMDVPMEHMQNLFGEYDTYIKKLENDFHVMIVNRDGTVKISGKKEDAEKAARTMEELVTLSKRGNGLQEQNIA